MNKPCLIPSLILCLILILHAACSPEAKWVDSDVSVEIVTENISAGFVECHFTTDKEAYYLIAITPADKTYDPMTQQKQFMLLAIDSANLEYLKWRNLLLQQGEFNVAPFASHMLRYGTTHHFFTGLQANQDYWVYAFAVNPETLKPIGRLNLITVHTADKSNMDIHFEYRVKGIWDYIYPVNSDGNLMTNFPYIATTRDSISLNQDRHLYGDSIAYKEMMAWIDTLFTYPEQARILYGVQVIQNDGDNSYLTFEEGHTYYTALSAFDGKFDHATIYKFVWYGEQTEYYFMDTDDANIYHRFNSSSSDQ